MTPSRFEIIVDFADCDPARIVFYPRYFEWFDRATERMFRSRGMPWAQLFPQYRMAEVALVDASASFRGPSRFGDQITVESWVGGELLGLSIDSTYSHLAWIRNIKEKFGVDIPFPIIDDLSMRIAHDFGMIQPGASDTSAVRATFFIDPEGKVRAMVYYPMTNGRSVEEFLRLLEALQTSDRHAVATPEGWRPGDKVMVPPPATAKDAEARAHAGFEYTDWYFSKTDVPEAVPKRKKRAAL